MEVVPVRVRNPFALKESLLVALEVAWPDMERTAVSAVRAFITEIPASVHPTELAVGSAERDGLLSCIAHVQRSRTWHWLREDMGQAIYDLYLELRRRK